MHAFQIAEKIKSVLRRMRWKTRFFLKEQCATNPSKETYDFKTRLLPKQCNELEQFVKDLFNVVKIVEFNNKRDKFQVQLKNDIGKTKQYPDILVFAAKTSNIYKRNTKGYQKLLKKNITVTFSN